MRRRRNLVAAAALAGTLVAAAVPAFGASSPKRTIEVVDDSFAPAKATIRKGTLVMFKWSDLNYQTHDVKLTSAPHGVKKYTSPAGTTGIAFRKRFSVAGTYKFVCTYHASIMTLTLRVKH
ncbi:MAG: blue (type 1) copper domain protein [Solirubrobacterales bacterium]|nr:blue (type 1) copper domain protein [Solirubrobacterales bacterium]